MYAAASATEGSEGSDSEQPSSSAGSSAPDDDDVVDAEVVDDAEGDSPTVGDKK
jgi:hypothetical protein